MQTLNKTIKLVRRYNQRHLKGIEPKSFNPKKDNLMVKGDNLKVMKKLLPIYKGKVKMIYIDPPYNTGNRHFRYNDKRKHSEWLDFMKKRLVLARQFLRDDGSIFISCDDNEQAYLKVLCDKIYGENNFIANVVVVSHRAGNQCNFGFANTNNYVLVYTKNIKKSKSVKAFNNLLIPKELRCKNGWKCDNHGYYKITASLKMTGITAPRCNRPHLFYPIFVSKDNSIHLTKNTAYDTKVLPRANNVDVHWRWNKSRLLNNKSSLIIRRNRNHISLYEKKRPKDNLPSLKAKTIFENPRYSTGTGTNEIKKIFHKRIFNYTKPEKLICDLIQIGSNENDIVLDFFAGSATTQAVAMKMHRRFIGVENMDYINTVSVPRLQKVINGERGGISKDDNVQWHGGGSFVYGESA